MAGVKFRSGDIPKAQKHWRKTVEDQARLVIERILRDKELAPLEKAKIALPIYLKTMTEKQAIVSLSLALTLDQPQVDELLEASRRNSLVYKDLEQDKAIETTASEVPEDDNKPR